MNGRRQVIARLSTGVMLLTFLAGCVSNKHPSIPDELLTDQSQYQYIIGPGDQLEIYVWGYEDLTVSIPVRPDGKITTRLVEDMPASGKTPTELSRDIEIQYANFVKSPNVSVTVSNFVGSPSQQIKVVGGGFEPRSIPYTTNMTLLDLMIAVGGLAEYSQGNKAVLLRRVDGERKPFAVRLSDLINNGDISADVPLAPGDIIMIPEAWF